MIHEVKLLKIHKRRYQILEQQAAKVGVHSAAHIIMEMNDIKESVKELETSLRRRLQTLREKAAVYGLSADPSITIEIEDIEAYFGD